ncbi:MAG: hypothetical protein K1X94_23525 [Sandaracinaceae bacterium]|nr:hypothetical protein [Sandaracinaceae bacterium]
MPIANEACGCEDALSSPPPGFDRATSCFDGCNWCVCTATGLERCTAIACVGDAGPWTGDVGIRTDDDAGPARPDAAVEGDAVALCELAASSVRDACGGQADRACEHLQGATRCASERADVLREAYACLEEASAGTGSCRTFGDPSGATACLDALVERTTLSAAGEALAGDLERLCPGASRGRLLGGGVMPIVALADATLARLAPCVADATDCAAVGACLQAEHADIVACYP